MRWKEIKEDAPQSAPKPTIEGVPQAIVDACYAGLDDLKHARGVPGEVVLAEIDRKIAEYYARKKNEHGENGTDSTTTDR